MENGKLKWKEKVVSVLLESAQLRFFFSVTDACGRQSQSVSLAWKEECFVGFLFLFLHHGKNITEILLIFIQQN